MKKPNEQLELLIRIDERLKSVESKMKFVIPLVMIILIFEFDKLRPLIENFVKNVYAGS